MHSVAIDGSEAAAATLIVIHKPSQTMTVTVNGEVHYRWRVSTGATGFRASTGLGGKGSGVTWGWGGSIRSAITVAGTTSSTARRNRPVCRAQSPST